MGTAFPIYMDTTLSFHKTFFSLWIQPIHLQPLLISMNTTPSYFYGHNLNLSLWPQPLPNLWAQPLPISMGTALPISMGTLPFFSMGTTPSFVCGHNPFLSLWA